MDDEFKLCWKNFQDNIASGFQNLYDRGDLVDVTLACDGKLLHAHKIVLAICSPYFQEIFITNPCKHPIIILKDVTFNIMCELLEFMYQGVVNVKHTELQSFMKIGQLLQIKGLATNSSSSSTSSTSSEKTAAQTSNQNVKVDQHNSTNDAHKNVESNSDVKNSSLDVENTNDSPKAGLNISATSEAAGTATGRAHSPSSTPTSPAQSLASSFASSSAMSQQQNAHPLSHHSHHSNNSSGIKRHIDFTSSDAFSIYSKKQFKRSLASVDHNSDHNESNEGNSMDHVNEDFFMPSIPHVSLVEPRYELNNVKRESEHGPGSSTRNSFGPAAAAAAAAFGFDYNLYKNSSNAVSSAGSSGAAGNSSGMQEYPNELHMPSDYSKGYGNHMDIPPNGSNVIMLSSTSLLQGNCVFNRNNTVATQQGMKTYWLCKSYRVSMCRARCITHQGRVISATGVHNHPPHMRGNNSTNASQNGSYNTVDAHSQSSHGPPQSSLVNVQSLQILQPPTHVPPSAGISSSNSMSSNGHTNSRGSNNNSSSTGLFHAHNSSQHHSHVSSPPPSSMNSMTTASNTHQVHHLSQPLPNMLIQHHHSALNSGNQMNLHQMSSSQQGSNSVIHNIMHNANNMMHLPNLHTLHAQDVMNSNNLDLASHHMQQASPTHLQSPSIRNSNNQTQHRGNSLASPTSSGAQSHQLNNKSPQQTSGMHDDSSHLVMSDQQHLLVQNEPLSPTNTVGSLEASTSSRSDVANNDSQHHAHVIDALTISPGNRHNFKIEQM